LSGTLLDVWRTATGRVDATLFEAVTSRADAAGRLREALRPAGAPPFSAEDLETRLDQFVDETLILIPAAFEALLAGDLPAFGRAVDRSQRGAMVGLGNQVPETIDLARMARSLGAHASSAFGAGFGGSVWALVSRNESERFRVEWERQYRGRYDRPGALFFGTGAGPGLWRADPVTTLGPTGQ
jgi:galactokinase